VKRIGSQLHDWADVLTRLTDTHGSRYDYSRADYKGMLVKIAISCERHGPFTQTPAFHMAGGGCPRCAGRMTTVAQLIANLEELGTGYDYSKVRLVKAREKIQIGCPAHGPFLSTIDNHRRGGRCPHCARIISRVSKIQRLHAEAIHRLTGWEVKLEHHLPEMPNGQSVDIFCPHTEYGSLVIEFDGAHWHELEGALARDTLKTELLRKLGHTVIRLREDTFNGPMLSVPGAINLRSARERREYHSVTRVESNITTMMALLKAPNRSAA